MCTVLFDLQLINQLIGEVGPERKIEFDRQNYNISFKLFKKLEKNRPQIPHFSTKHNQKKKRRKQFDIIFECRESLDKQGEQRKDNGGGSENSLSSIEIEMVNASKQQVQKVEGSPLGKNSYDQPNAVNCFQSNIDINDLDDNQSHSIDYHLSHSSQKQSANPNRSSRIYKIDYQYNMTQNQKNHL